jgi:signal transduction histidine kinase
LVADVVESFRSQAEVRNVELESDFTPGLPPIRIDESRMRQVLSNLLDNALKFTPEGGVVRLTARAVEGNQVEIRGQDSGPGILKDNLARIFDRNWQAKETAHLGTGLGLYIARGIMKAHRGEIWAESDIGHGATFVIRLPAVPASAISESASA